ncbi:MAG: alanine racemase [Candidatus Aminicenantes bacterium]|nr:alanine racemase [Candidatus Aminicenantes bacterium]
MNVDKSLTQWVEIDAAAFRHNVAEFRTRLGQTELMPVVKSNAYGHGLLLIARLAESLAINWLGVNSVEEGILLRQAGFQQKILVLGYVSLAQAKLAVEYDLRVVVYNLENIRALAQAASRQKKKVYLHLKVETGTNRQGIPIKMIGKIWQEIKKHPELVLEGLSSHFANIEDTTDDYYPKYQLENFHQAIDWFRQRNINIPLRHMSCSAASILFPETHFELARVGIGLYGLWPSKETMVSCRLRGKEALRLKPVLSWRARVAQVKNVARGAYVGYGCTYRTTRPTRLAVIPVGYYDGYDRSLSNAAYVLIRGKRAPVRGRVCMNFFMVDVTDIPEVKLEDQVTLIGKDGRDKITADQLATLAGTINYEIVSRINPSIPRVIVD